MGVTRYGCFCRKVTCHVEDGQRYLELARDGYSGQTAWHFVPIVDHGIWKVMRVKLLYPYEVHSQRGPGLHLFLFYCFTHAITQQIDRMIFHPGFENYPPIR